MVFAHPPLHQHASSYSSITQHHEKSHHDIHDHHGHHDHHHDV